MMSPSNNFYKLSDLKEKAGELSGQRVLVKGFLYHDGKKWILAEEPNLKQCCIKKCEHQIIVEGDFETPSPDAAIQVSGLFFEGTYLKEALILEPKPFPYWTTGFLLLALFCSISLKIRKRLMNRPPPLP